MQKIIPDYPNYIIFDNGNVLRISDNKILTPRNNGTGYFKVTLSNDQGRKDFYVHRLVALSFLPNPNNLPCVNHKNENRADNNINNLEWCSYQYNNQYGNKNEKMVSTRRAQNNYISKNKIAILMLDKKTEQVIQEFDSIKAAGTFLNVSAGHINEAVHGKRKTAYGYKWKIKE